MVATADDIIRRPDFATKGRKNDVCAEFSSSDNCFKGEINFSASIKSMPDDMLLELIKQIQDVMAIRKAVRGNRD
jgi:hypothetical protein